MSYEYYDYHYNINVHYAATSSISLIYLISGKTLNILIISSL